MAALLALAAAAGGYLYYSIGLQAYKQANAQIRALPDGQQEQARERFARPAENESGGILARVDERGWGGVWLWSGQGLKYYRAGADTVFSRMKALCQPAELAEELASAGLGAGFLEAEKARFPVMWRKTYSDIREWEKEAPVGRYVTVIAPDSAAGEADHFPAEIRVFDWFEFLSPIPICSR